MNKDIKINANVYDKYDFNEEIIEKLKDETAKKNKKIKSCWGNWPIVYIIHNVDKNNKRKNINKVAYVGETTNAITRMDSHLKDDEKKQLNKLALILSEDYNRSVTLDLESHLIRLLHADGFDLLNGNDGQKDQDYFNASAYRESFRKVWNKLKSKKIVKGDYDELIESEMFKFSPYKSLDPIQYEVENKVIKQALTVLKNKNEKSIVIEGGPGTGKTVLVMHMMKKLIDLQDKRIEEGEELGDELIEQYELMKEVLKEKQHLKIGIVAPIEDFRRTLSKVAKKTPGLKEDDVISPYKLIYKDSECNENGLYRVSEEDKYDILIVDETHRLCEKDKSRGVYKNFFEKGLTQYDWIKECSKVQIFFYDRYQKISVMDDSRIEGEFDKIKKEKEYYHELKSQFRCLGGENYIKHIEKILKGKAKKAIDFENEYEFYLFNDVDEMRKIIQSKDNPKKNEKARMIAGYAWKDNVLDKFSWNNKEKAKRKGEAWINIEEAVNEIGCIHTVQGHDINYAGIIIGEDLRYNKEKGIYIDYEKYTDKTEKIYLKQNNPNDMNKLKEQIINIYKVLLTRGINGTYVFACDTGLKEYLKTVMKTYNDKKEY